MTRLSRNDLEGLAKRINEITGNPGEPYSGQGKANVGCYYISGAYSGFCLEQIVTEGGGCTTVLPGYVSRRELRGNKSVIY